MGITEINAIDKPAGLTVEVPKDKVNLDNLNVLLAAKATLIKHALGIEHLPVEVRKDRVAFPWFSELPDADFIKACTHFIAELCKMNIRQTGAFFYKTFPAMVASRAEAGGRCLPQQDCRHGSSWNQSILKTLLYRSR